MRCDGLRSIFTARYEFPGRSSARSLSRSSYYKSAGDDSFIWACSKLVLGVGAGFSGLKARLTHTMDAVCRRWLVYSAKPAPTACVCRATDRGRVFCPLMPRSPQSRLCAGMSGLGSRGETRPYCVRLPRHRPGAGFLSADARFAAEPVVCGHVRPGITRRNPPLLRAVQLTLNAPD
jgi:hypothetical protein